MRTRARGTTRNRTPRVEVRIPGFTAEAGLQRTSAIWRGGTFFAARGHETGVEPQFCFASSGSSYYTCCYCAYGYCFCTVHRVYRLI